MLLGLLLPLLGNTELRRAAATDTQQQIVRGSPSPIADSPCIKWVHSGPDGLPGQGGRVESVSGYLPAIFTAWQWRGSKTPSGQSTGKCVPCSGKPNDIYCAYIFPCFAINTTTGAGAGWGHRDIAVLPPWYQNSQPCHVHRHDTGNTSFYGDHWLPAKGPHWQQFGWQVAQVGARVNSAVGQLITDPSGQYALARTPAAIPFPDCGAGVTGWVRVFANGTVGSCMQYDANIISAQICNGFELAYCGACKPCPPVFNASFDPGVNCTANCTAPPPSPPVPPSPPPYAVKPALQAASTMLVCNPCSLLV
jgi:hypothetical protein